MAQERSPTGSGKNIKCRGSQPNLSNIGIQSMHLSDLASITIRNKRKHCFDYDVNDQLTDIQKQMAEMMALLTSSITTQKESSSKLANDIANIKDQMLEIKCGIGKTEQKLITIATEHEKIKADVENINGLTLTMETKIASLECDLQKLKISPNEVHRTAEESYGDILAEITDQTLRKKNIIITGISEPQTTDIRDRQKKDKVEGLRQLYVNLKIYAKTLFNFVNEDIL
ncbi:unnamed protein product [Leptidea sinapis]|uniref:Uncharacterized protein n=1 Tax=Leptidea sinapis TaxID=189913 RepID=A0A5E4R712_9NEOP|nr:unnamed protein product [Leptidea sinapis]